MKLLRTIFISILFGFLTPMAHADEAKLWKALSDQTHFAVIRHALAPGTGDPAGFDLKDCSTQRNLSKEGRAQAKRIGEVFRKHGMGSALVFTSQWCRCKDTAKLMQLGKVLEFNMLNSFFREPEKEKDQIQKIRNFIKAKTPLTEHLVMVTHQVVITGLLDVFPSSGEIVVARWNTNTAKFEVLGSIKVQP